MRPATLLLALATVIAYLVEGHSMAFCQAHGFVPAHASWESALTSMFLHDPASWAHIGGNLFFLLVFGTLVERVIGSLRFTVLYFGAGLAGAVVHTIVSPGSTVALVGASGAIFGVLAAAAMIQPRVLVFVVVFVGFNLVGLFAPEMVGMRDVAIGCHIGGFAAGALMTWIAFSRKVQEVT